MVSARVLILAIFALTFCCAGFAQTQSAASVPPGATLPQLTPQERGDVYMARKMFREAIEAYREGGQNSAILWDKIGIAWHQLGDLNSARRAYERAAKIDKAYADPINNLGTIYYAEKRYRTAISRYQKAIALSPESAAFWSNLGTAYFARGKFEEMSQAYAKALELDKDVFERHSSGAGTRMQDKSVADRARFHYEMARTYAKAGKNDEALQYLRRALEEGFKDRDKLQQAPEFADLRETPEFKELLTLEPRVL
jgi:tetratricopeptide (TPR) repeat protein